MFSGSRRAEIAALLALREREGLTYEALSRRCGLAANTLSWWSRRLRREARDRSAFAEVEVADAIEADHASPSAAGLTVRRGAWEVEVGGSVDADQIRVVLQVLAGLPCWLPVVDPDLHRASSGRLP